VGNSSVYSGDADAYFDRNAALSHAFTTDHLLELVDRDWLAGARAAEFGIGNGQNLFLLKEYCREVHGFEISPRAVEHVASRIALHPQAADMGVHRVNLAAPFSLPLRFDLLLFGFFAYYCDESEMATAVANARAHLADGGLVHVVDFLVREPRRKPDARNPGLFLFKRDLAWWCSRLDGFDLLDFRLWDASRTGVYRRRNGQRTVDLGVSGNDEEWTFSALFRARS